MTSNILCTAFFSCCMRGGTAASICWQLVRLHISYSYFWMWSIFNRIDTCSYIGVRLVRRLSAMRNETIIIPILTLLLGVRSHIPSFIHSPMQWKPFHHEAAQPTDGTHHKHYQPYFPQALCECILHRTLKRLGEHSHTIYSTISQNSSVWNLTEKFLW